VVGLTERAVHVAEGELLVVGDVRFGLRSQLACGLADDETFVVSGVRSATFVDQNVTARGRVATLPIAICMAAALPIVSTVTYTVSELLEDRHTALMAPPGKPRLLARRVLDLLEDPTAQWSIADMARTEAYSSSRSRAS